MTHHLNPPTELALDFPLAIPPAIRPPHAVDRSEYAPELAHSIAERRAFNDRMVAKGSLTPDEAERDLAPLLDLAADVAAPAAWPRPGRTHSWAAKTAHLRAILVHRRKTWPQRVTQAEIAAGDAGRRVEALEGLLWAMAVTLAWCDAFEDRSGDEARSMIRAWHWAIDQWERSAADAGNPPARPERSTAARAARLAADPTLADALASTERTELAAAIALGIAVEAVAA